MSYYRLDKSAIPDYCYCYELRENRGVPATIECMVAVDFFGSIIFKEPLDLGKGYFDITDEIVYLDC